MLSHYEALRAAIDAGNRTAWEPYIDCCLEENKPAIMDYSEHLHYWPLVTGYGVQVQLSPRKIVAAILDREFLPFVDFHPLMFDKSTIYERKSEFRIRVYRHERQSEIYIRFHHLGRSMMISDQTAESVYDLEGMVSNRIERAIVQLFGEYAVR